MTAGAGTIVRLQTLLTALLDVPAQVPIADHLMGAEAHASMPGANVLLPEQVFVGGDAGPLAEEVAMSVYIAPGVLAHLAADDPFRCLHAGNLESFFVALEGVSHFVMVAWRAAWGLQVSALELEIQAEADKFVAALLLASRLRPVCDADGRALWWRLFHAATWRAAVPADERERYAVANQAAAAFCWSLLRRGRRGRPLRRPLVMAARRFFRQPLAAKLRASGIV